MEAPEEMTVEEVLAQHVCKLVYYCRDSARRTQVWPCMLALTSDKPALRQHMQALDRMCPPGKDHTLGHMVLSELAGTIKEKLVPRLKLFNTMLERMEESIKLDEDQRPAVSHYVRMLAAALAPNADFRDFVNVCGAMLSLHDVRVFVTFARVIAGLFREKGG